MDSTYHVVSLKVRGTWVWLIWIDGEQVAFLSDAGRLTWFRSREAMTEGAARRGLTLVEGPVQEGGELRLDLDRLLADADLGRIEPEVALNAWNLFTDLAVTLENDPEAAFRTDCDDVYHRVFSQTDTATLILDFVEPLQSSDIQRFASVCREGIDAFFRSTVGALQ